MTDPIAVVTAFLDTLCRDRDGMFEAARGWFTDRTVWDNVGLAKSTGVDETLALMQSMSEAIGMDAMGVETLSIAADGNKVLTERIDHFYDAAGGTIASFPVMGLFEVDDAGKLVRWVDYFDSAGLLRTMNAGQAAVG